MPFQMFHLNWDKGDIYFHQVWVQAMTLLLRKGKEPPTQGQKNYNNAKKIYFSFVI